jgi:hypothetical protein
MYVCPALLRHGVRPRIWGFQTVKIAPRHSIWPKSACVMAKWHFRQPKSLVLGSFFSGWRVLFIFGGHVFRQFGSIILLRELPGSVAGVYKWLLGPGGRSFWCFLGCFVAKNPFTPTQEVLCPNQSLFSFRGDRRPRTYHQTR